MGKKNNKIKEKVDKVLSEIGSEREEQMADIFNFKNKPTPQKVEKKTALSLWGQTKKQ